MIVDGWFDWAARRIGPPEKVNSGVNPVSGLVCHSADGFEGGLWAQLANAPVSWHLTNLFDGSLYQHYPLTARCWHATAFNQAYVGIEHEGRGSVPLTPAQVATTKRVIDELAAWKGWEPKRPAAKGDLTATLYEHREVIWFGGTATACPSGRIPWDLLLEEDELTEEQQRLIDDREGRVVLDHLLVKHFNTRLSPAKNYVIIYDPVSQITQASIPVPSLP